MWFGGGDRCQEYASRIRRARVRKGEKKLARCSPALYWRILREARARAARRVFRVTRRYRNGAERVRDASEQASASSLENDSRMGCELRAAVREDAQADRRRCVGSLRDSSFERLPA